MKAAAPLICRATMFLAAACPPLGVLFIVIGLGMILAGL